MRFSFKGAFKYDITPFSGINPPFPHLTLYHIFVHILKEKKCDITFWWTYIPRFLRNKTNAVKQLCKYLRSNYVLESSTFVPSLWAGLDSNGKATNNGAEAFHRHFGDLFGYLRCKPSLFHFLRIISRVNTLKDIKLRSTQKTVSQRNCDKDVQLFKSKRINVKTLLSRLSMKNLPKVNKYYKRKV